MVETIAPCEANKKPDRFHKARGVLHGIFKEEKPVNEKTGAVTREGEAEQRDLAAADPHAESRAKKVCGEGTSAQGRRRSEQAARPAARMAAGPGSGSHARRRPQRTSEDGITG